MSGSPRNQDRNANAVTNWCRDRKNSNSLAILAVIEGHQRRGKGSRTDAMRQQENVGEMPVCAGSTASEQALFLPIAAGLRFQGSPSQRIEHTGDRSPDRLLRNYATRRSIDPQLLELITQRAEGDAEFLGSRGFVVTGVLQGLFDRFAFEIADVTVQTDFADPGCIGVVVIF